MSRAIRRITERLLGALFILVGRCPRVGIELAVHVDTPVPLRDRQQPLGGHALGDDDVMCLPLVSLPVVVRSPSNRLLNTAGSGNVGTPGGAANSWPRRLS